MHWTHAKVPRSVRPNCAKGSGLVIASSVNQSHIRSPASPSPYEPEFGTTTASTASGLSQRAIDRAHATSSLCNTVNHMTAQLPSALLERGVGPSPSAGSADCAVTPAERQALGRFSSSTPQFLGHMISPLYSPCDLPGNNGAISGPSLGCVMPERNPPQFEQVAVIAHPDDGHANAPNTKLPTATELSPAQRPSTTEAVSCLARATPVTVLATEEAPLPNPSFTPPPPASHQPPLATPSRPRLSCSTIGHVGGFSPATGEGCISPTGAMLEHITRTSSLPLLVGSTVIPQGMPVAIPIAIAGVGAGGRARTATLHPPTIATTTACPSTGTGAPRIVSQSADHHFIQHNPQAPHYLHQSDGGAPATSPAQFVGSLSPSRPPCQSILSTPPPAAAAGGIRELCSQPDPAQLSPIRPLGTNDCMASAPESGLASMSCLSADAAQPPFGMARAPHEAARSIPQAPQRTYPVNDEDEDAMEQVSSLTNSIAGPQIEHALNSAARRVLAGDTDGDEEFEDAVEVQHDDADHMAYSGRSPVSAPLQHAGYSPRGLPEHLPARGPAERQGIQMQPGSGGLPLGVTAGAGQLQVEEDEEVAYSEQVDEDLLEEADDIEDEEEDDDEGDQMYGSAAPTWSVPVAPFSYSYDMQKHLCVNCTQVFWGPVCRFCRHPAEMEVVAPELLASAVRSMAAGEAASRERQQQGEGGQGDGVLLAYDDRCRAHLEEAFPGSSAGMGRSHPERPERVAAIMVRLQAAGLLPRFERIVGREATMQELLAVHDPALVQELEASTQAAARQAERIAARRAGTMLGDIDCDMCDEYGMPHRSAHIRDCYFNAATAACARLAAGSAADVARRVVSGAARHGAAIIRPPGHHAESSVAMGFCYYNNAAVAARAAQAAGARRVVIVDWDVHHGNGTQDIFLQDASVLYMSTHRYDDGTFYPGSGNAKEVGSGAGTGFTVNVPWNHPGVCDADMLAAFRHVIVPLAREFRPDLVIVSAGFDAVQGDPLGGCQVSPAAYGHFTEMLSALAPTVLLLEGGYNLTATAAATEACMRVLLGAATAPLTNGAPEDVSTSECRGATDPWVATGLEGVSDSALESLRLALRVQSQFWQAAREHQSLLDVAVEERQRQHLLFLQHQTPMQPREQWGWHVQMPTPSAPAPYNQVMRSPDAVSSGGGAGEQLPPVPPQVDGLPPHQTSELTRLEDMLQHPGGGPHDENGLLDQPRRMDMSTSGYMDMGD